MKNENNNNNNDDGLIISINYAHRHKFSLDKQILAYVLLDKTNDQPDLGEIEASDKVTFVMSYVGKEEKKDNEGEQDEEE